MIAIFLTIEIASLGKERRSMATFDLTRHRDLLLREVFPRYAGLGALVFAYLQGSLVSGYTDAGDLDVIAVWDEQQVPTNRAAVVSGLDARDPPASSVVDYRDVHLDRFVLAGQEYNVGHHALPDFRALVGAALDGRQLPGEGVLNPQALVAGFRGTEMLLDERGIGAELMAAVATFPPRLKEQARHALRNRTAGMLTDLRKYAAQEDWFAFQWALVAALRTALQILFAVNEAYYPDDKWLRRAMLRGGFPPSVIAAFDRAVGPDAPPAKRIAAVETLMHLADAPDVRS